MKELVLHSEARAELDAAVAYYERLRPGAGLRFLDEIEKAFNHIRTNPRRCAVFRDTDHRKYVVPHFPYLLFYVDLPDKVRVTAIAHAKRRPGYWQARSPGDG